MASCIWVELPFRMASMHQLEGQLPRGRQTAIDRWQGCGDLQEEPRIFGVIGALQRPKALLQVFARGLPVAHGGGMLDGEATEQKGHAQHVWRPAALLHLQAGRFRTPATCGRAGSGETPGLVRRDHVVRSWFFICRCLFLMDFKWFLGLERLREARKTGEAAAWSVGIQSMLTLAELLKF